jgi:hypothetical protein
MPAHAEALKSQTGRQLDFNLMARKVDGALERARCPRAPTCRRRRAAGAARRDPAAAVFTRRGRQRGGPGRRSAVDWNGPVDIDLRRRTRAVTAARPGTARPAHQPSRPSPPGPSLADHVQIGFSYQMHLDGEWQKVRLSHVSPARSFFIFTHGRATRRRSR